MKVLLVSSEDKASLNIRDRLLEEADWERVGRFQGTEVLAYRELLLYQKKGIHLHFENVDLEIASHIEQDLPDLLNNTIPYPLELLVFLSKHRSETGTRSLTVHPPGNYLQADYGGQPGRLPPSAPHYMAAALKALYREKKLLGLADQTTYEVTHHGPYLSSPCFFIEIGSDDTRWCVPELGRAIARALLSSDFLVPNRDLPVAIGVGGGHYAPRFTDRAMRNKFAFGHMIPDHILERADDTHELVRLALASTPGADRVMFHRNPRNEDNIKKAGECAGELGLELVQ
ncbi:MAG: hypothetical protein JW939_08065 [Candidatus Thermoplasmatota archaeon]|nr:hypothetical protein [Candidatus Thermoplasmatota archaeon]